MRSPTPGLETFGEIHVIQWLIEVGAKGQVPQT